jgi:hypothetical protein
MPPFGTFEMASLKGRATSPNAYWSECLRSESLLRKAFGPDAQGSWGKNRKLKNLDATDLTKGYSLTRFD